MKMATDTYIKNGTLKKMDSNVNIDKRILMTPKVKTLKKINITHL